MVGEVIEGRFTADPPDTSVFSVGVCMLYTEIVCKISLGKSVIIGYLAENVTHTVHRRKYFLYYMNNYLSIFLGVKFYFCGII